MKRSVRRPRNNPFAKPRAYRRKLSQGFQDPTLEVTKGDSRWNKLRQRRCDVAMLIPDPEVYTDPKAVEIETAVDTTAGEKIIDLTDVRVELVTQTLPELSEAPATPQT